MALLARHIPDYDGLEYWGSRRVEHELGADDVVKNNLRVGKFPDPDVIIGFGNPDGDGNPERPMPGWEPDRIIAYGRLMGYLDNNDRPRSRGLGNKLTLPEPLPDWWHVTTVRYASIADVAQAWGISLQAARQRSAKGRLGPRDILIDNIAGWPRPGFLPTTVVAEGAREGFTTVNTSCLKTT